MSSVVTREEVTLMLDMFFHHSSLRPGQFEAVNAVMAGKDVFLRMGTGSGKSMCMFLPPLCSKDSNAAALIVSPLKGLMEQQVSRKLMLTILDRLALNR